MAIIFSSKVQHKGFSLIELMVVIAIIAITAAIAVPIYQDNLRKTNVSKIVSKLNSMQTNLTEQYMLDGNWPATLNGTAVDATSADSSFDFVQSFRYDTNSNKAWFGYKLSSDYGDGWVFMVLIYNAGVFEAHCGSMASGCVLGYCDSIDYYPHGCNETGLSATYGLT